MSLKLTHTVYILTSLPVSFYNQNTIKKPEATSDGAKNTSFTVQGLLEMSRQSLLSFDRKLLVEKVTEQWLQQHRYRSSKQTPTNKHHGTIKKERTQKPQMYIERNVSYFMGSYREETWWLHIPRATNPNTTTTMTLGQNFSRFCFSACSLTGSFSLPLLPQPLLQLRWACWGNTERADVDVPQRKLCPHPLGVETCVAYSRLFRLTVKQQATKYGSSAAQFTFSTTGAQRREQDRLT